MKIDNSVQRHFLIRFLEISGLKGANRCKYELFIAGITNF